MLSPKYKITNITVKPKRIDPVTGLDTRTVGERVGHFVQFKDKTGRMILVNQSHPKIVDEIDGGIIALQRKGLIKIDQIQDVITELKQHTSDTSEKQDREAVAATQRALAKKATAIEMGLDNHGEGKVGGNEYEGATNPDGNPNFLVTAPRGGKKRQQEVETPREV